MTETVTQLATADTAHASRYLQQLCKHWTHRFTVEFDPESGRIDMGQGVICELAATPQSLKVVLSTPETQAPRMREVVENHLRRFAHREPDMTFDWRMVRA